MKNFLVVLADSGQVVARRRSLEEAKQVALRRMETCPAKFKITTEEKLRENRLG
jgi:hypothetical protein